MIGAWVVDNLAEANYNVRGIRFCATGNNSKEALCESLVSRRRRRG